MAKLVVNIKGQSEEFGLTDDARDIGGNDYLTVSNGNKKQYARLGSSATKLIVRKNNQKFYVQKDPVFLKIKRLVLLIKHMRLIFIYRQVNILSFRATKKLLYRNQIFIKSY